MASSLYAYSLTQAEAGWAWRVYDEDGRVVASGCNDSQACAERSVSRIIHRDDPPAWTALGGMANFA